MPRWKAVLFDFDGVIVNSEPLHLQAFQEVLAGEDLTLTEEEYFAELIGFDDKGSFRHVFGKHGRELDPRTFLRLMTRKSEVVMDLIRRRKYQPLVGVEETVRGLWRAYPLAICSGALREEIEAMLEGISLRDCFSVIVAAEDVTRGKPDPEGYLKAMDLLSARHEERLAKPLTPEGCLVVEDSVAVASAAREAGFRVLGLGATQGMERMRTAADFTVATLRPAEVLGAVKGLRMVEG